MTCKPPCMLTKFLPCLWPKVLQRQPLSLMWFSTLLGTAASCLEKCLSISCCMCAVRQMDRRQPRGGAQILTQVRHFPAPLYGSWSMLHR